jgi:hypothetical protein
MLNNKFGTIHLGVKHSEMEMAPKSMDKDRDDQYLTGEYGVTRPIEEKNYPKPSPDKKKFNESIFDGFNNIDKHSAGHENAYDKLNFKKNKKNNFAPDEFHPNQVPSQKGEDITLGRSNSSASTTSHSALSSSEAMSRDTKKL